MVPSTTDVLIVGAGPTGLALAIGLQQAGVEHVLVDRLDAGQNTSRAAVIHAHTLDMLDGLGVSAPLVAQGLKLSAFTIRDRDRRLLRLPFDRLPTRHPFLLMLPQDRTEQILTDRLTRLGGKIHRGLAATRLTRRADGGVDVTLDSAGGGRTVTTRLAVGADGMHSVVRAAIGTAFSGSTYEESFVLADVAMDWSDGRDEVQLFFSPRGLVVVAPLPGGLFRIVATLDGAPEQPAAADIQSLLNERGPTRGRAEVTRVAWSSRFRVHHRLANAYRDGPLILMGDAAHVHSPAGGQGMNTGLVDACVLGRLITESLAGQPTESTLDRYQRLRRPAAQRVLGLAGRLTRLATMSGPMQRRARNAAFRLLDHLAPAKHALAMDLSGLSREHFAATARESDRARPA